MTMRGNTLASLALAFTVTGCGADPGTAPTGADEEALRSSAWSSLLGAYALDAGDTGPYAAVVLERTTDHAGHHYFAESFASLIHCGVGTGCTTTHERTEGWYTATARGLVLHPDTGASESFTYTLHGASLTLTSHRVTSHFTRETTYCDTPADCDEEAIVHPLCAIGPLGGWHCGATHACAYVCGNGSGDAGVGTGVGAGHTCGGIAGIQCQSGLECVYPPGAQHPDEAGTCRVVSGVGGPCGGFTTSPAVCATGLHCVLNHIPDIPGTCQH